MAKTTVPATPDQDPAESPDAFRASRWAVWHAAAPLFELHGFDGVTFQQVAEASGMAHVTIYRYFPNKQAVALFPLSHAAGVRNEWEARLAELPDDREERLRRLIDFAAQQADAWRLATALSSDVAATPGLERYASRLLREVREDLTAMVISVDPGMTPRQFADLYEAFRWHVVSAPINQDLSFEGLCNRLTAAVRGWTNGVSPLFPTADGGAPVGLSTSWPLRTA